MISTAPHPTTTENFIPTMSIAMAITTQVQSSTAPGGAGPSGGGNPAQAAIGDRKPMGTLPTIFEGDHSKAESFLREFSTYLLVNYDVPALTSFIKRIAITLTCIKGLEVN